MIFTCPCCHARYSLDAANQDEAARELLALRGEMPPRLWHPMIAYLGLFRSESRALAWDRALKICREVLQLGADPDRLETALCETVESLRLKGGKPLKNHNYLKRVLENSAGSRFEVQGSTLNTEHRTSNGGKRTQALNAVLEWGSASWLHQRISLGFAALIARSLKGQPGADTIVLCADTWHLSLKKILTIEEIDAERCMKAFDRLLTEVTEWPQPKRLIELLPRRPERAKLRAPEPSAEEHADNLERMRKLREESGL